MKINHVLIDNWESPGGPYWEKVEERHTEPLIEATIKFTLSWDEYHALIMEARKSDASCVPV